MNNLDIRQAIAKKGIKYWQLAVELGIHESTLSVWLRKEMDQAKKETVLKAIESIRM